MDPNLLITTLLQHLVETTIERDQARKELAQRVAALEQKLAEGDRHGHP